MGTLAAIPFYLLMASLPLTAYVLLCIAMLLLGIWICGRTARDLGVHDHQGIVWDEFVGFWITMTAVPLAWQWVVLGFILFRLFDILKPWPIRWVDKHVHGGLGIMLDDVLAGILAAICMQLILAFI